MYNYTNMSDKESAYYQCCAKFNTLFTWNLYF